MDVPEHNSTQSTQSRSEELRLLGLRLRQLREDKGLSQRVLATKVKCSQSLIAKVERGERDLPRRVLKALKEHLGIDVAQLVSSVTGADVLRAIASAWNDYHHVQSALDRIGDLTAKAQLALSEYRRGLLIHLDQEAHDQAEEHFAELDDALLDISTLAKHLPDRESHPEHARISGRLLPSPDQVLRAAQVINKMERLAPNDFAMIDAFLSTLTDNSTARRERPVSQRG